VLIFVTGIFLVASGLREVGLTDALGALMLTAAEAGSDVGVMATGFLAGTSSAVLNNHPVAQLMALTIADLDLPEATRRILAYAALIGGDLGPKMLPIGSLAALMWFRMLRDRGVGGVVVLEFFVSPRGDVSRVEVAESSGHGVLDRVAERMASEMRFLPALNRDRAVGVWVSQRICFVTVDDRRENPSPAECEHLVTLGGR
jgi:TonB family protein